MAELTKTDLTFTGERFIPGEGGARIAYEHFHRYYFAQRWTAAKVVLDLGCGEGYGAALLAQVAKRVTGLDLSPEAIAHAQTRYPLENLSFRVSDCRKTGEADHQFDVVLCFEMLEHIEEHQQVLNEVRRVLKPGGLFVVSSPDKQHYSDVEAYENPFHVRELYIREFHQLLQNNFTQVRLFAQSLSFGSVIRQIGNEPRERQSSAELIDVETKWNKSNLHLSRLQSVPKYAIAVCSNAPLSDEIVSLGVSSLNDTSETVVKDLERQNCELLGMIDTLHGHLRNVGNLLVDKDNRIAQRDLAIQEKENHITVLHQVIEGKDRIIAGKDQGILGRDELIHAKDVHIAGLEQGIQILREFEGKVKSSFAWKLYRALLRPFRLLLKRERSS